ncbi:MAG: hypothetical protein GKR88_17625 [Flavobacteriaceae bacterium]|nr:MAG: hypothetical protein GKR88_17625 [Flavobacteriaceae bacterium]
MATTIDLRSIVKEYINTTDTRLLKMVKALVESYQEAELSKRISNEQYKKPLQNSDIFRIEIDLASNFFLLENFKSSKPMGYSGLKFSSGVELFCQINFAKASNKELEASEKEIELGYFIHTNRLKNEYINGKENIKIPSVFCLSPHSWARYNPNHYRG